MSLIRNTLLPLNQITLTAGTRQPLSATPYLVSNVIVQADPNNVGDVYIGDVTVVAAKCIKLTKGNGLAIDADSSEGDETRGVVDLNEIYVDCATSGDKVNVLVSESRTDFNNP